MQEIATKVEKQELEITYIKKSLDELVEQNKKQNEQLGKISESIQKQEVILEKVSNLEDKYTDGLKRCHKRIDETVVTKNGIQKQIENETIKTDKKIAKLETEIDKLRLEVHNRPCVTHNVVENELKHINETLANHKKIFWSVTSVIVFGVLTALIKSIMK